MKKIVYLSIALAVLLILMSNSSASAPQWKIDPPHSSIYFSVNHIYSTVRGFFDEFEGIIEFDPANPAQSRFDFSVNVKSLNTNNNKRDGHLQSGDFFDAGEYPQMTFKSQSISHMEGNQYAVEGILTVKDVSQSVRVPFTFLGTRQSPLNPKQDVAGFEARMTIDRLAYHVGSGQFYQMGALGKDVDVLITIEATRDR